MKRDNNLLIYTSQETATFSGKYNFVFQPNAIVNGSSVKIADVTGQSNGFPFVSVSQSLTSFVLADSNGTDSSKPLYVAKSVNYQNKAIKDITLPAIITNSANILALSDNYLYGRTAVGTLKTHFAFVVMGSTLQPLMN